MMNCLMVKKELYEVLIDAKVFTGKTGSDNLLMKLEKYREIVLWDERDGFLITWLNWC